MSERSDSATPREPEPSGTTGAPVSEWMRWNDVGVSLERLPVSLDLCEPIEAAPLRQDSARER
jgi:hypothetical protein